MRKNILIIILSILIIINIFVNRHKVVTSEVLMFVTLIAFRGTERSRIAKVSEQLCLFCTSITVHASEQMFK